MSTDKEKVLIDIFNSLLQLEGEIDPTSLKQTAFKIWDSMMMANLVMAVENEFQITISNDEYEEFTSFSQILAILNEKDI